MPRKSVKKITIKERYEKLRKQIKKNNGRNGKKRTSDNISPKIHDDHGLSGAYYLNH